MTTTGASALSNSNSNSQISTVATVISTSGIRIRTANVNSNTATNSQVLGLVNNTTGEVEYVNKKYSQTFLDTDFSSQILTITAATHKMGSNLQISVFSGAANAIKTAIYPAAGTPLISITVSVNGDVTLTSTSGSEFAGLIIIS